MYFIPYTAKVSSEMSPAAIHRAASLLSQERGGNEPLNTPQYHNLNSALQQANITQQLKPSKNTNTKDPLYSLSHEERKDDSSSCWGCK